MSAKAKKGDPAPARIFAYIAKDAPVAVILRRGPSKQVCMIRWDLKTDKLEVGQWFKGRIYEWNCDLSPDGEWFLYFAANFKPPFLSWTALCKPPYLTAMALWPKGDCWDGGGKFISNTSIQLDHPPGQDTLAEGFELPKNMRVNIVGRYSGKPEEAPVSSRLAQNNDWNLVAPGDAHPEKRGGKWVYKNPAVVTKPGGKLSYQLRRLLRAIGNKDDPWYWMDYDVLKGLDLILDLPRTDWADWDHSGDLLFAREGKLFRIKKELLRDAGDDPALIKQIADLNGMKFEAKPPPQPKKNKFAKKREEREKRGKKSRGS